MSQGEQVSGQTEQFTRHSLVIIGICSAIYFLDGLIHTILGPLAPAIAADMGLANSALGPIFSANLVGQTLGLVTFPIIANRFGHRSVILIAACGFVLAQWATALAWGATSLFAFRLVDAVFLGCCLPSCLALVAKVAPRGRTGLAVTMMFTGYGAGATVSGIVAAIFADGSGGWRGAIASVGFASLLAAIAAWIWLRGIDDDASAFDEGPVRERPRAVEVVRGPLLIGTLLLWLMFIAMLTVQYCLCSWLPTLLVEVGRDRAFAALSVTIFSLGGIIAALGVGLLIDRFGASRVLGSFLAIATVLLFAIGQVLATASAGLLIVLLATGGFFFLGAYGGVNVVLATYYPEAVRAVGIGLAKSVGRLGTIVAPVLIGLGLDSGVRETTVMSLFSLPAAVATLCVVLIGVGIVNARGDRRAVLRPEA